MRVDIYQLSKILSKQKLNSLGLFKDAKNNSETQKEKLFNLILENKVNSDEDAKAELGYISDEAFAKLKVRYTRKLIDYFLLVDWKKETVNSYNRDYYRLLKNFTVARLLHNIQQKSNAVIIYEYVFKKASKFEFLDLMLLTAIQLKRHYAYIEPNIQKFKFFTEAVERTQRLSNKEIEFHDFYDQLCYDTLFVTQSEREAFKQKTLEKSQELLDQVKDDDTFYHKSMTLEVASFAFNLNDQPTKSIDIAHQTIVLFEQAKFDSTNSLFSAYKEILFANLKLKRHDESFKFLYKILDLFTIQGFNYFKFKGLEFTLYTQVRDYNAIYKLTAQILAIKSLKEQTLLKEEWGLREGFVNILLMANKISPELIEQFPLRKFKLHKFINEVDHYAKDKRGINITIQIIQLIHFLMLKQYDKLMDRLDALKQYTYRYLRNDDTLRSNCFIKMLFKIPEAEYHPLRTKRYVEKYYKKLQENPLEITPKEISVEIIPYEHLWEIILEILDSNLTKKKN